MISRRRRGLGEGTCQWPQPGVQMVYPPCSPTLNADTRVAPVSLYTSVYDVPGLLLPAPSSCVDSQGYASGSPACVDANIAVEQENMRRIAAFNAALVANAGQSTMIDPNTGQVIAIAAGSSPAAGSSSPAAGSSSPAGDQSGSGGPTDLKPLYIFGAVALAAVVIVAAWGASR